MLLAAATVTWTLSSFAPGLFEGAPTPETLQAGQALFVHQWTPNDPRARGDGLGPVFNANSCVACHFQGGVGGSGDKVHNVTAYEIHPNLRERYLQMGLVHAFAVDESFSESHALLNQCYPIIKGGDRVVGGCTVRFEDFDPVSVQSTNSIALFGDGLIDRISQTKIKVNHARRLWRQISDEIGGEFEGVGPGRPRILADGRIGKFGWKAQFATLEEFVAAACANELGLGNPLMEQAKPLGSDYRCEQTDLTRKELRQLVAFVDALPRPVQVRPQDPDERSAAQRGEKLFGSIGCTACHVPDLDDVAGIYSDLMLHSVTSRFSDGYRHEVLVEVPLPLTHPEPDEWRTPPLWGVADTAPYFHDGGSATLEDAILRHAGSAAVVTNAFKNLPADDQRSIITFLETLKAPADAQPAQSFVTAQAVAVNQEQR
jgi:CxxC motif-containing protein (DUF1111 family)